MPNGLPAGVMGKKKQAKAPKFRVVALTPTTSGTVASPSMAGCCGRRGVLPQVRAVPRTQPRPCPKELERKADLAPEGFSGDPT